MSLWYERPPSGSHAHDVALDRPIFTRTATSMQTEVRALIEELLSKNGVPIVKVLASGRAVEKTLHLDNTGMFLVYSPSFRAVLDAAVFIPSIAEFRPGCVTEAFRKVTILPDRIPYCFSLLLRSGEKTWNFSVTKGNQVLWKNAIEYLMRRAWRMLLMHPLKIQLIHIWYCGSYSQKEPKLAEEGSNTNNNSMSPTYMNPLPPTLGKAAMELEAEMNFVESQNMLTNFSAPRAHLKMLRALYLNTYTNEDKIMYFKHELDLTQTPAVNRNVPLTVNLLTFDDAERDSFTVENSTTANLETGEHSAKHLRKVKLLDEQKMSFSRLSNFMTENIFVVPALYPLFAAFAAPDGWSGTSVNEPQSVLLASDISLRFASASPMSPSGAASPPIESVSDLRMTVEQFQNFHEVYQHEVLSFAEASELMGRYRTFEDAADRGVGMSGSPNSTRSRFELPKSDDEEPTLTFGEFSRFLVDPTANSWFKPRHRTVYQDMTQPMCHYFISSSHNTYLTGDQFASESSTEMYRTALLRGSRCIELDCWDGSDGFPIIYHGHTRTSKISFESVIRAIEESAFVTSPYPVTLSLEVHTSPDQQHIMAVNIYNIFKHKLLRLTDDEYNNVPRVGANVAEMSEKDLMRYTPEALKYRIIVKSKRKVRQDRFTNTSFGYEDEWELEPISPRTRANSKAKKKAKKEETDDDDDDETTDESDTESDREDDGGATRVRVSKRLTLPDVVGMPAQRCSTVKESIRTCEPYHVSSFGERRMEKLIEDERDAVVKLSSMMTCRIYPKGSRINSSNYDPQPCWNVGCQMVALNFQTLDYPMRLNEAKFEQNGKCGYILKPHHLRHLPPRRRSSSGRSRARNSSLQTSGRENRGSLPAVPTSRYPGCRYYQLHVRVIAGHLLPKVDLTHKGSPLSPFVSLWVNGVPEDQSVESEGDDHTNGTYNTRVVSHNGMNPTWLQHFTFNISCIELATLTLRLCDGANGYTKSERREIAEATIPLPSLQLGYRSMPLRSVVSNQELPYCSIMAHFALQELS